jgi:hypothetical protein
LPDFVVAGYSNSGYPEKIPGDHKLAGNSFLETSPFLNSDDFSVPSALMKRRFFRIVSLSIVLVIAAAPGSATVTQTRVTAPSLLRSANTMVRPQREPFRAVRRLGTQSVATFAAPTGCTQNGSQSFVGESGPSSLANYAGGGVESTFYASGVYAGVLAGEGNESCDGESAITAGDRNVIGGDGSSPDDVIAGGALNGLEKAQWSGILAGFNNLIGPSGAAYTNADTSVIAGGTFNSVGSPRSFVGAGNQNVISSSSVAAEGQSAFIGAGAFNTVAGNAAGIVGGEQNTALADFAMIGGGYQNNVGAQYGTIGGGLTNKVAGQYGAIGGGYNNVASGMQAAVAGGYGNTASGRNAVIPGGAYNVAGGLDSLAAGNTSHATYDGTFVWSDYSASSGITSTGPNQFLARAAGGFYLYSSATLKSGVKLAPGSGSWSSLSDRAAKTGVVNVDDARILAKVAALPVSEWSYTSQGTGVRHIGPMAQDFRAAFSLGEDDRHIATIDEEGIALAAIKALQAKVSEKDRELAEVRRTDQATFERKYARLEQRLDALEAGSRTTTAREGDAR